MLLAVQLLSPVWSNFGSRYIAQLIIGNQLFIDYWAFRDPTVWCGEILFGESVGGGYFS